MDRGVFCSSLFVVVVLTAILFSIATTWKKKENNKRPGASLPHLIEVYIVIPPIITTPNSSGAKKNITNMF